MKISDDQYDRVVSLIQRSSGCSVIKANTIAEDIFSVVGAEPVRHREVYCSAPIRDAAPSEAETIMVEAYRRIADRAAHMPDERSAKMSDPIAEAAKIIDNLERNQ
jgi:hypothetical protein